MVIGAFPAAKLGALLLKQISKPLANLIIQSAKSSPTFRMYVCMPPAQFYNWCEVKTKMWILNLGKPINIPVLNESMAIELGANLLGEAIIFTIAATVLLLEYNRSARKELAKETAKQEEMELLNNQVQELFLQIEQQRVEIKELMRIMYNLDSQLNKKEPHQPSDSKNGNSPKGTPPSTPGDTTLTMKPKADNTIHSEPTSLLMSAVQLIENDYIKCQNDHQESGILIVALNYLYKDLYKLPVYTC